MEEEVGTLANGKVPQSDALLFGIYCCLLNFTARSLPFLRTPHIWREREESPRASVMSHKHRHNAKSKLAASRPPRVSSPVHHTVVTLAVSLSLPALNASLVYSFCPLFSFPRDFIFKRRTAVVMLVCGLACFILSLWILWPCNVDTLFHLNQGRCF